MFLECFDIYCLAAVCSLWNGQSHKYVASEIFPTETKTEFAAIARRCQFLTNENGILLYSLSQHCLCLSFTVNQLK